MWELLLAVSENVKVNLKELVNVISSRMVNISDEFAQELGNEVSWVVMKEELDFYTKLASVMGKNTKPALPFFEDVAWPALALKTRKMKAKYGLRNAKWLWGHSKYEKQTLQEFFEYLGRKTKANFANNIINLPYFGTYPILNIRKPYVWTSGQVLTHITVKPALSMDRQPFKVADGSYMSSGNGSGRMKLQEDKLMLNEEIRPLFEPMRMYFLYHRIPSRINAKLSKHKFKSLGGKTVNVNFKYRSVPK